MMGAEKVASQFDVRRSVEDPVGNATANIVGTIHVLESALATGTRRLVNTSTGGGLYGEADLLPTPESAPGNDKVRLKRVAVVGDSNLPITVASPFSIEVEFWNYLEGATLNVAIEVFNQEEICAFSSFSRPEEFLPGVVKAVCRVPGNLLNDSVYRIKVLLVRDAREQLLVRDSVMFEAHDVERDVAYFGKWTGVVRPTLNWSTEAVVSDNVCGDWGRSPIHRRRGRAGSIDRRADAAARRPAGGRRRGRAAAGGLDARKPPCGGFQVDPAGLEPATSTLPASRSPN